MHITYTITKIQPVISYNLCVIMIPVYRMKHQLLRDLCSRFISERRPITHWRQPGSSFPTRVACLLKSVQDIVQLSFQNKSLLLQKALIFPKEACSLGVSSLGFDSSLIGILCDVHTLELEHIAPVGFKTACSTADEEYHIFNIEKMSLFPFKPVGLSTLCRHMCHVSLSLCCIQLTPCHVSPADTSVIWLLALQPDARFSQPQK